MAKVIEDAIIVHKTEVVFYDKYEDRHYRLNAKNIVKVVYDYAIYKSFFGLATILTALSMFCSSVLKRSLRKESFSR